MMRTRGLAGSRFVNNIKSIGNFIGLNAPPPIPPPSGNTTLGIAYNDDQSVWGMHLVTGTDAAYGSITPTHYNDQILYALTGATAEQGVTLQFGQTGNERITSVEAIKVEYDGATSILTWDGVFAYRNNDTTFSAWIKANIGKLKVIELSDVPATGQKYYFFNGIDSYADFPLWTPFDEENGGYVVGCNIRNEGVNTQEATILSSTNTPSEFGKSGGATYVGKFKYKTSSGDYTGESEVFTSIADESQVNCANEYGEMAIQWREGVTYFTELATNVDWSRIGADATLAKFWKGFIYDLYLTDDDEPTLNRHYPMNEGTGNVFIDVIGGQNATIMNHVEANWRPF